MAQRRKRINISVDVETYDTLQRMCKAYGFKNCSTIMVAFAHIVTDRIAEADKRRYDLEENDGEYIDMMFDELAHTERQPDGLVPKKGHKIDIESWRKTKNT